MSLKQGDECGSLADFCTSALTVKYSFSNFSFKVSHASLEMIFFSIEDICMVPFIQRKSRELWFIKNLILSLMLEMHFSRYINCLECREVGENNNQMNSNDFSENMTNCNSLFLF